MSLEKYRDTYEEASGTLSTICRSIAFAGIGIVWVLANENTEVFPRVLIGALVLLALSLLFDMLHYLYKTILFHIIFRKIERNKLPENYKTSILLNKPTWCMFWLKISFVIVAFGLISWHLIQSLF